jgi:hypothetical protein
MPAPRSGFLFNDPPGELHLVEAALPVLTGAQEFRRYSWT